VQCHAEVGAAVAGGYYLHHHFRPRPHSVGVSAAWTACNVNLVGSAIAAGVPCG
jgi:hypothetical protein